MPTFKIQTRSVPTITCPYCRTVFVGKVERHGPIRCGKCGKTMMI